MATASDDLDSPLPSDGTAGTLIGRVWRPDEAGPSPVAIRAEGVFDLSRRFATVRDLCEAPLTEVQDEPGRHIGSLAEVYRNTDPQARDATQPWFISPIDLQTIKAAGVTFARSMVERVIEERLNGNPEAAGQLRDQITSSLEESIVGVVPGSERASRLKEQLSSHGLWSAYLEVGLGPDAEIFTKAPTLASVGTRHRVGVPRYSNWNNPEPEVVLVVRSDGVIVGATLGNDVNLRDVEGRSALLLPQAKDNNASCALGPFIRLFDDTFGLVDVQDMTISIAVSGDDQYTVEATYSMSEISRSPADLVAQAMRTHQYPDGFVLMLGTMFAPVDDRDEAGMGFTHRTGDVVRISSEVLGILINTVDHCESCPPWDFGLSQLMQNLAARRLLGSEPHGDH